MIFFFIFQTTIVSGRRGSTSSDKKRSKSRARSKSPFRSFRWPKSKSAARQEPQPGSYSDDEDNVSGSARSTLRKFFRENIIWYIMFCCAISRNFWRGEIILNFFIPWNCIKVVEYFVQIWWLYRTKKMVICTDIYISGKTHILIYPFLYSSCTFLYVFI